MNINSINSSLRYVQKQPVNNGAKSTQANKNGGIDTSRPLVFLNPPDEDWVPNIEYNPQMLHNTPVDDKSEGAFIGPPVILNPPDDEEEPNFEYNPQNTPVDDKSEGAFIGPPVLLNPPDEDGNTNEKNPFDNMSLQDLQDLIDENINDAKDLFSK